MEGDIVFTGTTPSEKEAKAMSNLPPDADRRGYLLEDFRLFHLKETRAQTFSYHYHEFDKVVLFLSGEVTYTVEGRAYFLTPGDLLLVPHHHIHQPDIGGATYERRILWLTPEFLRRYDLDLCFRQADETGFHLVRPRDPGVAAALLERMESAREEGQFAAELLVRTCCIQFLIELNRAALHNQAPQTGDVFASDRRIQQVMAYINANLTRELTVDALAAACYLSPSWLMHRFKAVTGCTVHQYVLQKRLIAASDAIRSGTGVMQAAREAGFRDYSAFLRSFRAAYHTSPKSLLSSMSPVGEKNI